MATANGLSYADRLGTFRGYWDGEDASARQLAALGHVSDRPPLEAIEEGSRCVDCSQFVAKATSIRFLDGRSHSSGARSVDVDFHQQRCIRLQVRIPLEPTVTHRSSNGLPFDDPRKRFEKAHRTDNSPRVEMPQESLFFSLPTELRLSIYAMVLPRLDKITPICLLHRNSPRVVTRMGYEKIGPRDLTQANILRVCRAIHGEALDIIYAKTTFRFGDAKTQYLFLRQIGPHGRSLLRAVDVVFHSREDALAFALLGSCANLNAMTLRIPRRKLIMPFSPIWTLDGVACLLEISGLAEVTFESCEGPSPPSMRGEDLDAALLRKELQRPRDSPSGIRWINMYPDL